MAFREMDSGPPDTVFPGPREGGSQGPMTGGSAILSEGELGLIAEMEGALAESKSQDLERIRERFQCLKALGEAAFRFPSVREAQRLMGEKRDESRLIESLCSFSSPNHLLHIPTKVLVIRSFLVAKFHYFSMLHTLAEDKARWSHSFKSSAFQVISTLMVEAVYFSCLEDPSFSPDLKQGIANDLISLWDSGDDPRVNRHLPALEVLWVARKETPPAFGTMDGNSELFRLSFEMGPDWQDFLTEGATSDETRWALEEFLFGLSYEEIRQVRARLLRFRISAVNYDEVKTYLGHKPSFATVEGSDMRNIFDFYTDRQEAARFRKRTAAPGPYHTLEELYLRYRILQEEN
ncbi:MAG: hypothetical protein LBB77_03670 [Treponema sp.]|jgi:hypothetical protein|nr:hypothetical protein [Treponema sp.]